MTKPFLLLQIRPETPASDNEFEAFCRFGGFKSGELERIRMETDDLPDINLDRYSAILVGGGPSNVSDPQTEQPPEQKRYQPKLFNLIDEIISRDFPYLGACYGLGVLAVRAGGIVSKERYGEDVGAVEVELSPEASQDDLTVDLPGSFKVFVGHKEACQNIPPGCTLLASSVTCPIQMIRVKQNVYATQFHPELDSAGLALRIKIYKNAGYFPPDDAQKLIEKAYNETVTIPERILKRFVDKYRQ